MADFATISDVESNWRSLRPAEQSVALRWLTDASNQLRFLVSGLDAMIAADDALPEADRRWIGANVNQRVAFVVRHRLRGADRSDSTVQPFDSFWWTDEFLDALRSGGDTVGQVAVPVGAFPAVCPYPAL